VAEQPRILELFPNPTAAENRGEYLVVRLPERGNWSLSDGYYEAAVPANASGVVALSMDPANTTPLLDDETAVAGGAAAPANGTPRVLDGYSPLAASGDRIELRRNGTAVAVVDYDRAPEGHRWRADWGEWRPRGYDPRPVVRTENATVTPFVLPDSPEIPVEPLRAATTAYCSPVIRSDRSVSLTCWSRPPTAASRCGSSSRAHRSVGSPRGAPGSLIGSWPPASRFACSTETLNGSAFTTRSMPSPTTARLCSRRTGRRPGRAGEPTAGGASSPEHRDPRPTTERSRTTSPPSFREEDAAASDARSWSSFRNDTEFHESGTANESYPTRFEPPAATTADVELLTTPGNAADRLVARIDAADDRVLGVVPRTGGPDNRIVRALRRAAERAGSTFISCCPARGTTARRTARWSTNSPTNRLRWPSPNREADSGKIHEGARRRRHSRRRKPQLERGRGDGEQRGIARAVEDGSVADFYARSYAADWRGGGVHLPIGLLGGLGVALAGAGFIARREVAFV